MPPSVFSQELTKLRKSSGLTQSQLASRTGVSLSSLNRWLLGGSLPKRESAEKLDELLNADGSLLARFDETREGFTLPVWLRDVAVIETKARTVSVVATVGVPGYLQSPRYAELVFRDGQPWLNSDDIHRLVSLRCQRLSQLPDLRVTAVFPVTALTAVPGEVRAEQVEHLLDYVSRGRVTLHLLPEGSVLLNPAAPVMLFKLPNGETVATSDYATGTVVADAVELPRIASMATSALAASLPVRQSLEVLESLRC